MTRKIYIFSLLALSMLLSACTWLRPDASAPTGNEVCSDIRQQIINNNYSDYSGGQRGKSPTVAAKLYKDYDHYNCPELVDENKDNPLPPSYRSGNNIIQLTK